MYDQRMGGIRLPPWLRRGLESGIFAGVLSLATVVAYRWDTAEPGVRALPGGLAGSMLLALPVLAVGVFALAYPVGLAATRSDAVMGAIAGFLVGADILALASAIAGERIRLLDGTILPIGVLAALLAVPAAVAALLGSQLLSPLGFGRRAGRIAAIAATIVATPILLVGVPLLA